MIFVLACALLPCLGHETSKENETPNPKGGHRRELN